MHNVIGVRMNFSNNIYYFSPNTLELKKDDAVIVYTEQGLQYGICVTEIKKMKDKDLVLPVKNVVRLANDKDKGQVAENEKLAAKALVEAKKIAKSLKLDMNFISSNYTFDKKQLFFIYLADDRVDFRELAKKLAQKYKTRIELRQVGVRDKAKIVGGLGPCGLFLCCNTFLSDFNSVSINMAKNQLLALSPSKINGVCGRLLCCLNYEDETYSELKKKMPKIGYIVDTKEGKGKVVNVNVLKNTYQVELSNNTIIEIEAEKHHD